MAFQTTSLPNAKHGKAIVAGAHCLQTNVLYSVTRGHTPQTPHGCITHPPNPRVINFLFGNLPSFIHTTAIQNLPSRPIRLVLLSSSLRSSPREQRHHSSTFSPPQPANRPRRTSPITAPPSSCKIRRPRPPKLLASLPLKTGNSEQAVNTATIVGTAQTQTCRRTSDRHTIGTQRVALISPCLATRGTTAAAMIPNRGPC